MQLHFENFVCQNERIWTLRWVGARASGAPGSANEIQCESLNIPHVFSQIIYCWKEDELLCQNNIRFVRIHLAFIDCYDSGQLQVLLSISRHNTRLVD